MNGSVNLLTIVLPTGNHPLELKVLPEQDATSTDNRVLIDYFMVGGLLLASQP